MAAPPAARNYLLWAVAGLFLALPPLIDPEPAARGMVDSMFAGLWLMGVIGLRHPLQMLPIFLFEFAWKSIWLLAFGLPQWIAGTGSPRLGDDLREGTRARGHVLFREKVRVPIPCPHS